MPLEDLLSEIKKRLRAIYGDKLKGVILYGSEARGDAKPDSDIDILCILDGPVSIWKEIGVIVEATRDLETEGEEYRPIMIIPVDVSIYETKESGFLREIKREGVAL